MFSMQLFYPVLTSTGKNYAFIDQNKMKNLIQGKTKESRYKSLGAGEQTSIAVRKMRQVTGTFMYMQDKDIAKAFAKEKNRIEKMIGHIDRELPKTPRVIRSEQSCTPWQTQDLEKKWGKYMDDVFDRAKQRGVDFMDFNLKALNQEQDSQRKTDEFKSDAKENKATQDRKQVLKSTHEGIIELIKKTDDAWDYFTWRPAPYETYDQAWGIKYVEPRCSKSPGSNRRLEWWTSPWKPDPELRNLFQQIGRSRFGDGLEELWTEDLIESGMLQLEDVKDGILGEDPGKISSPRTASQFETGANVRKERGQLRTL